MIADGRLKNITIKSTHHQKRNSPSHTSTQRHTRTYAHSNTFRSTSASSSTMSRCVYATPPTLTLRPRTFCLPTRTRNRKSGQLDRYAHQSTQFVLRQQQQQQQQHNKMLESEDQQETYNNNNKNIKIVCTMSRHLSSRARTNVAHCSAIAPEVTGCWRTGEECDTITGDCCW